MALTATAPTSRKSILVIDDSDLCREMTVDCLRAQGFQTVEAADAIAALRQIDSAHFDLIVVDYEMPGMNGLAFLRALRANPERCTIPVIMLTSSTSKEVVVEAMRHGVRGYLLKARFTMTELVARIGTILAGGEPAQQVLLSSNPIPMPASASRSTPISSPALTPQPRSATVQVSAPARAAAPVKTAFTKSQPIQSPNLVTRSAMMQAIVETTSTKTLAGVVAEVVALANSPHSGVSDLVAILRRDPVLSSRIVQLACSAAYAGAKSKPTTIDDAARTVGSAAVRDLALTVGIYDSFPSGRADGIDLLRCWQHAFGVAAVMDRLVPRSDRISPGTPHLIGLCHDLGEIMIRQRFPKEYAAAVDFAVQKSGTVYDQFPAVFGISMTEVIEALLDKMKLPPVISEPIAEFSRNARGPVEAHGSLLARALAIANSFAHALGLTPSVEEPIAPALVVDCRTSLLPTTQIDWMNLRAEATSTICALSKLKSGESTALGRPLIARQNCRVGYLRHHAFAQLDPMEAAIDAVCQGMLLEGTTRPEGLQELDGLIVLCPAGDNSLAAEALRLRGLAGSQIPILHITPPRNGHPVGDVPAFEEIAYPVTLKQLSRFAAALVQE